MWEVVVEKKEEEIAFHERSVETASWQSSVGECCPRDK